jgi:hypothetical protein
VDQWGKPMGDVDYAWEEKNGSRQLKLPAGVSETDKPLVHQLDGGWLDNQGAVDVLEMTKERAAQALADRKRQVEELKAKEGTLALANVMEQIWAPGGKWITPKYEAIDAYRRSIGIRGVFLRRWKNATGKNWDRTYAILISVMTVPTGVEGQRELFRHHTGENYRKTAGQLALGPKDHFATAVRYLELFGDAANESGLMAETGMKRGEAQRAFALADFARKFPGLKIKERVLAKTPPNVGDGEPAYVAKESFLPIASLQHKHLVNIKNDKMPETMGGGEIKGGRAAREATIEAYFKQATLSSAPPVANLRKVMSNLKDSPIHLFQMMYKRLNEKPDHAFNGLSDEKLTDRINKALAFLSKDVDDYAAIVKAETEAATEAS